MRRAHLVGADPLQQLGRAVEHAHVRAEELVGRAGEEVAAQRVHVHRPVRRVLHGVDVAERARFAGQPAHRGRVRDGAGAVRGPVEGGDARCGRQSLAAKSSMSTRQASASMSAWRTVTPAVLGGQQPRRHVAVVVDAGDQDLVAGAQVARERARGMEGERRHVGAEHDLAGVGPEHGGRRRSGPRPAPGRDAREVAKAPPRLAFGRGSSARPPRSPSRAPGCRRGCRDRCGRAPATGTARGSAATSKLAAVWRCRQSTIFGMRLAILGGGPAGYAAAATAAHFGAEVTLIEDNQLGGNCTMTDAIPSKTLLTTADAMLKISQARGGGRRLRARLPGGQPAPHAGPGAGGGAAPEPGRARADGRHERAGAARPGRRHRRRTR